MRWFSLNKTTVIPTVWSGKCEFVNVLHVFSSKQTLCIVGLDHLDPYQLQGCQNVKGLLASGSGNVFQTSWLRSFEIWAKSGKRVCVLWRGTSSFCSFWSRSPVSCITSIKKRPQGWFWWNCLVWPLDWIFRFVLVSRDKMMSVCVLNVRKGYGAWNLGLLSCAPEFSWPDLCFRDRKGRSTIGISITSKADACTFYYFLTLEWMTAKWTGWWFQLFFSFWPLPGEMIQFDVHIFQMGWFNHQPVEALGEIQLSGKDRKLNSFSICPTIVTDQVSTTSKITSIWIELFWSKV